MPILISAVLVWFASALLHMVLPHHKGDFEGLPDEAKVLSALDGVKPGSYMFPWCSSMAEMKSPELMEKQKKGPNGTLTVFPGAVNMGRNLGLSLVFYIVVGILTAYVASHSLAPGVPYLKVFQICGAAAFMAHGLGWMPFMIWFGFRGFWAYLFDSLVFALVTAGTFGWLWPR
jgi:hypothetical protein